MAKKNIKVIIQDWVLVIAMVSGASIYLIYHAIPQLHSAGPALLAICKKIQPVLLFAMLFMCYCRIRPSELRPHKWQLWLLLIQGGLFFGISGILIWAGRSNADAAEWICRNHILIESAMICLICPTATSGSIITGKLGGNMAGVLTYTIMINLLVAVSVPLMLPLLFPQGGLSFFSVFLTILGKIFPLLILPCLCAWLLRLISPKAHALVKEYAHVSFYIWSCALTLAILMSTREIVHSGSGFLTLLGIALASMGACAFQFWAGKRIGARYGSRITAGQALGQKNTVFAIWMGYTFFSPIVSVAGGFYSIWHNIVNTLQLRRVYKRK